MLKNKYNQYFFVIFVLLLNISITFSSVSDSTSKLIFSKINPNFSRIEVVQDSLLFEGYMVFKITENQVYNESKDSSKYFICDVYWINSLEELQNGFPYLYISYQLGYWNYVFENEFDRNNTSIFDKFRKFYYYYRSFYQLNVTKFPFLLRQLTTEIFFRDIKFWKFNEDDKFAYYIFDNSFIATLLKCDFSFISEDSLKTNDTSEYFKGAKILIPISREFTFYPINDDFANFKGLTESDWYPDNLFNKPYGKPYDK